MHTEPHKIMETVSFAFKTVWAHRSDIIRLLKPIIFQLIVLTAIANYIQTNEQLQKMPLWNMISLCATLGILLFSSVFAIGWYRLLVLKELDKSPVRLTKLKKHEIQYIFLILGMIAYVFVAAILTGLIFIAFKHMSLTPVGLILAPVFFVFCMVKLIKLSLYFPAKAVGAQITLKEAYTLGKGLIGRLFWSTMLGSIPIIPLLLLSNGIAQAAGKAALAYDFPVMGLALHSFASLPGLFVGLFGGAIFSAILAHYYLWAIEKRSHLMR